VALGRVVLHQRERLMALEPRDKGIVAYSLRAYGEVRQPDEYFHDIPAAKADEKMIDIAERIIEQLEGPFDPTKFDDRYEEALKALVEEKRKGHKLETVKEPEDTGNVVDLMEALRRSLGQGTASSGGPKAKAPAKHHAPSGKAAGKSKRA